MNLFTLILALTSVCSTTILNAEENLRVISLAPVITEIISELDQEKLLVGRTAFCTLKNENLKVPSVGSFLDTSIEGIFSLKPDIVLLLKTQKQTAEKLDKLGIKTVFVSNQTIGEINQAIVTVASALKVSELGTKLVARKTAELKNIKQECSSLNNPKTAIFIFDEGSNKSRTKFFIASKSSFFNEIMSLSNLENLFKSNHEYAEISVEGIYSLKPELIFLVTETKDPEKTLAYLKKVLKLGTTQKIILLPKEPTIFPGPRYPEIFRSFVCRE